MFDYGGVPIVVQMLPDCMAIDRPQKEMVVFYRCNRKSSVHNLFTMLSFDFYDGVWVFFCSSKPLPRRGSLD